jgi:hypothetical protein
MANEFKHKDPGSELTQAEFIASDGTGHIFDSQAAGDILYASSTTALARLAKGSDGTILELASGVPAWTASPTIGSTSWANATHAHAASNSGGTLTALGTVATGVWQGTAIATTYIAADAITGAKIADDAIDSEHYTDGSIDAAHLAADAVTGAKIADDAIDSEHYTDGSIDNAHLADDAVDSDEIAAGAIDTAHIADNQVTVAKIEDIARGSIIYGNASAASVELTKGGADEVLTSDGTDIAWAAAAGPSQADQTAIEARTNQDTYIAPDMLQFHDGVAKAWSRTGTWPGSGSDFTILDSYNVDSITDNGTGLFTHTWTTDFASANTYVNGGWGSEGRVIGPSTNASQAVGSSQNTAVISDSGARTDSDPVMFVAFGDQ